MLYILFEKRMSTSNCDESSIQLKNVERPKSKGRKKKVENQSTVQEPEIQLKKTMLDV